MKHLILVLVLSSMFVLPVKAQGFYFSVDGGYGIKMFSAISYTIHYYSNSRYKAEAVRFSLGQGLNGGITAGYNFNPNIGMELRLSYLLGSKKNFDFIDDNWDYKSTYIYYARMFNINPSVVVMFGEGRLKPVFKAGFVMGFGKITSEETTKYSNLYSTSTETDYEKIQYSGGMAFGFNTSLGVLWKMNDNFYITANWYVTQMQYSPAKREIIVYTENGEDKLDEIDTIDRVIYFVDSVTDNDNQDDDKPGKSLKVTFPFGNTGLRFGVQYRF